MTFQHADIGSASDRLVGIDASITSTLLRRGGFQDRKQPNADRPVNESVTSSSSVPVNLRGSLTPHSGQVLAASQTIGEISAVLGNRLLSLAVPAQQAEPDYRYLDSETPGPGFSDFKPRGGVPKRILDIVIAATALILLSPLMLMIALAIRLSMGSGPVVFAQSRVGFGGKTFVCYKFRTMVCNGEEILRQHLERRPDAAMEWATARKLSCDPRVTSLGYVLRKSSLDELPQLVNVLLGEMSCVGPRPVVVAELSRYGTSLHEYISCRPGLTGMWQINGRNSRTYADRVALDRLYARKWTLGLDLAILVATIPALLKFRDTA